METVSVSPCSLTMDTLRVSGARASVRTGRVMAQGYRKWKVLRAGAGMSVGPAPRPDNGGWPASVSVSAGAEAAGCQGTFVAAAPGPDQDGAARPGPAACFAGRPL